MQFHVEGMTCGGCARAITRALVSLDRDARVQADPRSRTVTVETSLQQAEVRRALADAGFPASAH